MATPNRNLIIERIATALGNISIANGYKTDVTTATRLVKSWGEVGPNAMPWIGFRPERSSIAHQPGQVMRVTMPVTVIGHVNAAAEADRSDQVNNLLDDIIAALLAEPTFSNAGVALLITGEETDEGEDNAIDSRGGSGTVAVYCNVIYNRSTGST